MNQESDRLEHLFSRVLDGECTGEERDLLAALLRDYPVVAARFEQYRRLDRCVRATLRQVLQRRTQSTTAGGRRPRVAKALLAATAACLAALAWLTPRHPDTGSVPARPTQAASWFAAGMPAADVVEPLPGAYVRPELRVHGAQRDWLVFPGRQPNSYLVVEVDRVRTHVIPVHRDF